MTDHRRHQVIIDRLQRQMKLQREGENPSLSPEVAKSALNVSTQKPAPA
jgi:hypothetical protein